MMFLSLLGLLVGLGLLYQWRGDRHDARWFPAPGRLVKTSYGETHLNCKGQGDVTVILEAGQGDCSLDWTAVQEAAARFTKVCAYDRPGLGWSSLARKALSPEQLADNLHQALENGGMAGPYVLVGHSVGGIYGRAFAQRYPDEVAGLVFVDSAHENQRSRLPSFVLKQGRVIKVVVAFLRVLAPLGIARLLKLADRYQGADYDEDMRPAAMACMYRTHFFTALSNEIKMGERSTSQSAPPADLGDKPLVVLTQSGKNPGVSDKDFAELSQTWNELQQELVQLSTNSKYILARESGHYIQHDEPRLVVNAIRQIVRETINGRG